MAVSTGDLEEMTGQKQSEAIKAYLFKQSTVL
jgi:hypothetical protein